MREIGERLRQLGLGEFEFEVGARRYRDILKDSLCVWTVCDLVIQSVVARDGFAKVALCVDLLATPDSDICKVRKMTHAAIEISPDRPDLRNAEQERVHEANNVECHFHRRVGANALTFDVLHDNI